MELESQDSLNLRINNTLFIPTQTSTKQGEYSYSFELPATPSNNKALDYANNLSKLNKFHTRYPAQVYADGKLIFDGSLTIQKYNAKEKMYECNLVNIKISNLEEIFGDDVLTDVKWMVDYNGAETINSVNTDSSTKYSFPLVCYGAFAKKYISKDEVAADYTSKYTIDDTNQWWTTSFYPSLNMLEEAKKCFEYKGYKVGGNAFYDPIISEIYCSTNLDAEQNPTYNLGNPKIGSIALDVSFTSTNSASGDSTFVQDLRFPYCPASDAEVVQGVKSELDVNNWNFKEVFLNSLLKHGNVTLDEPSTMYEPESHYIVIPEDGFYKVRLQGSVYLNQGSDFTASQVTRDKRNGSITWEDELIKIPNNIQTSMPIEIQLVKNYDENIELIKGKNNLWLKDGNPNNINKLYPLESNQINYTTCYPHEAVGYRKLTDVTKISDSKIASIVDNAFLIQGDGDVMCYDPVVNPDFICGWTTMGNNKGGGTTAIIKDGYSWSKTYSERHDAMYKQNGYFTYVTGRTFGSASLNETTIQTYQHKNSCKNAPSIYYNKYSNSAEARVSGIVYLKKNDRLELMAVRRGYFDGENMKMYLISANLRLSIEAASPKNINMLRSNGYNWNSMCDFSSQLNLMNFTNKQTKISDWLKNIKEAFNLEYLFNGETVDININKGIKKTITNAIDIDNRVSSDEAESEYISYPKEMSVRYKIDTEEHGFYNSVPSTHINDEDWKDWGDSGFTVIQLNDDSYETSEQNTQTNFSYTWYDNFKHTTDGQSELNITIPVISKEEYMIDNYNYEEAMAKRGFNLPQRFWFRSNMSIGRTVKLQNDYYINQYNNAITPREVYLFDTKNQKNSVNLSYKATETSLVTEFFNIHPMLSSNYVTVDVYLNPEEYQQIKDGAMVKFDSDLYYVSEIQGYDATGNNPTTLKLIKKV